MAASPVSASASITVAAVAVSIIISVVALTIALDERGTRPTADNGETQTLGRDAIYQGSATLAGLAIFGSLFSTRIKLKFASRNLTGKTGVGLFVICPYLLALSHILFMFHSNPSEVAGNVAAMSLITIVGTVSGYVLLKWDRANTQR